MLLMEIGEISCIDKIYDDCCLQRRIFYEICDLVKDVKNFKIVFQIV